MTLYHDITIIRNCTTSEQMFAVAEAYSQRLSDLEDRLYREELDYNWDGIEFCIKQIAVTRYAYKFAYEAASEMEEDEHECMLAAETHDAMMGDRI